ncbi:HPr family phosphocarrier protein [Paenibacillus taichungensis]|uniref:Phosphocarrier protein HPr n=1 Tax=Paenibacillus taichungensis TaxID=484184 RepID=A0ABX2MI20_9BACL|nr:HPr family phosphocarrier protein [Paenibacillus taichungensis]NUU52678.1 HPr family phosphocarrier protein [Paenibacillus taichungensis]
MIRKTFIVTDETGIHARPSTILVNSVSKLDSEVKIIHDGKEVNLKSILGILSLGMEYGYEFDIVVNGSDEVNVLETLEETLLREGIAEIKN